MKFNLILLNLKINVFVFIFAFEFHTTLKRSRSHPCPNRGAPLKIHIFRTYGIDSNAKMKNIYFKVKILN
uniref:Putative secreted protein n=1 Tax=Lutzomyia longipalpis TaxID=7200 RepID=A0A7G3AHE4_LUTLO